MGQSAFRSDILPHFRSYPERAPIVIVGNGPVGMRMAREILNRLPQTPVVIYGDEEHEPYNRVQLSACLAGDVDWQSLYQPAGGNHADRLEQRIGFRVISVDPDSHRIVDTAGHVTSYRKLVLATGSHPFVPDIPGIERQGVFTFRDLDDTQLLMARRARSHQTVVLGGGLLGLEVARGMQPGGTEVSVIEHGDRLLGRQLDEEASTRLEAEVKALGIRVVLGDGVKEITGGSRVRGVLLRSGRTLPCDTLIVATGIRANMSLAKEAGLAFARGIRVDDRMRTSDADIYAIGECAEHREQVYGLVGPGFEQAGVAAADIAGLESRYQGSVAACRLKVVGTQVFSMGPVGDGAPRTPGRSYTYRNRETGIYRKILVHRNRIIGAIGIGDWNETVRLQTHIGESGRIWPWQLLRFHSKGELWPLEDTRNVAAWPAASIVCQCTGANRGQISEAIEAGACQLVEVGSATGAGTVCGSCKPLVQELLGQNAPTEPVARHRTLLVTALLSLLAAMVFLIGPNIPYADTVQNSFKWDLLWRDGLLKQISGFTVLGLFAVGLTLSLRKRVKRFQTLGGFDLWRLLHVLLGVAVITALALHTGFRLGSGLNMALMLSFASMLLLGGLATGVIALEHRIGGALSVRLRRQSVWLHILLFWPVPALLGWHIFKTYWY